MAWRWGWVCSLVAVSGCAILDQPPPEAPPTPSAQLRSRYEPLAALCECSVGRAEADLGVALRALESDSPDLLAPPGFAACVNALTGVPTIVAPAPVVPGKPPSFSQLNADIEKLDSQWSVSIEKDGRPGVFVHLRPAKDIGSKDHGVRAFRTTELKSQLEIRIGPSVRALENAHLTSQLCHSTALYVAIESRMTGDHSHSEVVRRLASSARKADGIAAATSGIFVELRRVSRTKAASRPPRMSGFSALRFDGEFDSDGDDVERNAARHVATLGASAKPGGADPYSKDLALPLWLAPRPRLGELCDVQAESPERAMKAGLVGLREGDLGAIMLGARVLYPNESTAHQGLATLCAVLGGDDRKALQAAREMVPGYSSTGQLLLTLSEEPG